MAYPYAPNEITTLFPGQTGPGNGFLVAPGKQISIFTNGSAQAFQAVPSAAFIQMNSIGFLQNGFMTYTNNYSVNCVYLFKNTGTDILHIDPSGKNYIPNSMFSSGVINTYLASATFSINDIANGLVLLMPPVGGATFYLPTGANMTASGLWNGPGNYLDFSMANIANGNTNEVATISVSPLDTYVQLLAPTNTIQPALGTKVGCSIKYRIVQGVVTGSQAGYIVYQV